MNDIIRNTPPPPLQYDQLHMIIIFLSVLMKTEYPMVSNETFSSLITLQSQNLCGFQRLIQIRFHINGQKKLCLNKLYNSGFMMLRYQSYASSKTSLQLAIQPQFIDWQQQTEDPLETPLHVSYCDKTVSEHKCEQLPADKFILSSAFFVSLKISYGETACSKLWLAFLYIHIYRET